MASITRLDHSSASMAQRHPPKPSVTSAARIFRLLGIDAADLAAETVTVNSEGLRALLRAFARLQPFDPEFYAETYPDIEAARMAGLISDIHEHFTQSGFIEGRLASDPPFDPAWYAEYYPDLKATIPASDVAALRNHFITAGLAEGRAGTASTLNAPGL